MSISVENKTLQKGKRSRILHRKVIKVRDLVDRFNGWFAWLKRDLAKWKIADKKISGRSKTQRSKSAKGIKVWEKTQRTEHSREKPRACHWRSRWDSQVTDECAAHGQPGWCLCYSFCSMTTFGLLCVTRDIWCQIHRTQVAAVLFTFTLHSDQWPSQDALHALGDLSWSITQLLSVFLF